MGEDRATAVADSDLHSALRKVLDSASSLDAIATSGRYSLRISGDDLTARSSPG